MSKTKPVILIPLSIQFSVRYIIRTGLLSKLISSTQPVILLGWQDRSLQTEIEEMGCKVYQTPYVKMSADFARLRKKIHIMHFDNIDSCSTEIDRRRNRLYYTLPNQIKIKIRESIYQVENKIPGKFEELCSLEQNLLSKETNIIEFDKIIKTIQPDILFSITPFFLEEEFIARASQRSGIKLITSILSFDNLTTRPRIPVIFDQYLLWNKYNKQELFRIYPETKNKMVSIVGPAQFDFYYDPNYLWDESVWRKQLGLPEKRKVILFASGPYEITPLEPHWLVQLDEAIDSKKINGNPIILLRRHPVDSPNRWKELEKSTKHVIFEDPWLPGKEIIGRTNIMKYDIEKLVSTLKYSDVHINTSSTMTVDGAIFNKPQIGPAYDDQPGQKFQRSMQELYKREHFLPIMRSKGLELAQNIDDFVEKINFSFERPNRLSSERSNLVKEICTHDDGKASERILLRIHDFIEN